MTYKSTFFWKGFEIFWYFEIDPVDWNIYGNVKIIQRDEKLIQD